MTLYKDAEILEKDEQAIYPILKGDKLAGVLTYKDIKLYLKKNTKMDNGVIPT
jgi:osmoprotectant transport system ATP-binding protein